jgi:putative peptidoglycan lipid II flippase
MLIASYFGTSAEYDILIMAMAIPLMISSILFMSIPSAGIPFLQEARYGSLAGKGILKSSFFKINTLLILVISAVIFILLPFSRNILASGLEEKQVEAVIKYGRLFCLLIPFKAYEAVFRSLLHIKHHFIFPSATNLGFNIIMIAILVSLFPSLAFRAFILAWIVGTFVQSLLVGIPSYFIYRNNRLASSSSGFKTNGYMRYLGVIVLLESISLIAPPFDRYLGGIFLDAGYVSAINYAEIVNSVPLRIFIFSLGTAIFPTLSEKAGQRDIAGLSRLYHRAMALCIMLIIPISVFSLIFKNEIVGLLFERGKFIAQSRLITVEILKYYLAGLFFISAFFIQVKALYALKLWRPTMIMKFLALVLKCLMGILLIKTDWALAIGGGTVAMNVCSFFLLEGYLVLRTGMRYSVVDIKLFLKAIINALVAIGLFILMTLLFGDIFCVNRILLMLITGAVGFIGLFIMDMCFNVSGISFKELLYRVK